MFSRMDVPDLNNSMSIYRIIGIFIAFVIFASVISYSKDLFTTDIMWFKDMSVNQKTSVHQNEDSTRVGPMPLPVAPDSNMASNEQTWCFIGEDMAGNWCVQVSSPVMCPKDRSFNSKNQCEKNRATL